MEQPSDASFSFTLAASGLTRFPPNVEQITVERCGAMVWLTARRNDVSLRFPMSRDAAAHLSALLVMPSGLADDLTLAICGDAVGFDGGATTATASVQPTPDKEAA